MLKGLQVMGILALTVVTWVALFTVSPRYSLSYPMFIAILVLPALHLSKRSLLRPGLALLGIALALAASPIDFKVQGTGRHELTLMPTSFGPACDPTTTACYGCIVSPNDPRYAIVLSP